MKTTATTQFLAQPVQFAQVEQARIAYRTFGDGPALILLHGFPFSSLTYRHLVPHLARHFTCYVPDTPGLGASEWDSGYDFHFLAQARTVRQFIDTLDVPSYTVLGHDSGATLARLLSLSDPERVERIVLLNTEMPGHRPPWIPLYTALARIPGSTELLRPLCRWRPFLRSRGAFGEVFFDRGRLTDDFFHCVVNPIISDRRHRDGVGRYLLGFDWAAMDDFRTTHSRLQAPVLMIWGADDPFFPIDLARQMATQFTPTAELAVIPQAKLLVHEECPEEVATSVLKLVKSSPASSPGATS